MTAVLALLPLRAEAGPAKEGRGERALRASLYLNSVPTMVEMVGESKKAILDTLKLDAGRRAIVEKALDETWTEKRIYSGAAASLEKQLSPEVLDAALAQMTPEVQAAIKAGIVDEASPEQAKAWLEAARKRPDAKEREALARRIAAHLPQPEAFQELVEQVVEVLGDVAQVATGTDDLRAALSRSFLEELEPLLQAMGNREAMALAAVIAYRDQPTSAMKALADALDSDPGRQLQRAAITSLLAGGKQARQDLVARLQRELKVAPAKAK
ncbi:MAG TPA: hypothetical protein VFA20_26775 [Myxococcaceae bacterium]|nr:hypothetical protein [Myxococcaceae bacterium]